MKLVFGYGKVRVQVDNQTLFRALLAIGGTSDIGARMFRPLDDVYGHVLAAVAALKRVVLRRPMAHRDPERVSEATGKAAAVVTDYHGMNAQTPARHAQGSRLSPMRPDSSATAYASRHRDGSKRCSDEANARSARTMISTTVRTPPFLTRESRPAVSLTVSSCSLAFRVRRFMTARTSPKLGIPCAPRFDRTGRVRPAMSGGHWVQGDQHFVVGAFTRASPGRLELTQANRERASSPYAA